MGTFVAHTLHDVPSSAAMAQLGIDAERHGQLVWDTMDAVHVKWKLLDDAFTVIPYGSPAEAMAAPTISTSIYSDVMSQAKGVLCSAADEVFAPFEKTRESLQLTIENLNYRHAQFQAAWDAEVATFVADPENDPVITGRNRPETSTFNTADVNLSLLDEEAAALALDVDLFHRALAQAEQDLADKLRGLSGGDSISRQDGTTTSTSQSVWGLYPPGAAPVPGYTPEAMSLSDYFEHAMSQPVIDRISWLANASKTEVDEWLASHPEFFETVGYIPPEDAATLYDRLSSRSVADESGEWIAGPLAALSAVAPGAIGNLNGLKTSQRVPFAEKELQRLLADPSLTEEQRTKLRILQRTAQDGVRVLSVFIDDRGSPRASLMLGDPDTADQIITVTHGIATDLGQLGEWGTIARDVLKAADAQLDARHLDSSTAVILQMEWDSGEWTTVWQEDLPQEGAAREVALVEGLRHVNPDAWQEAWAHSLGTTLVALAMAQSPGVFDHVTLFGSAGVTEEAAEAMEVATSSDDVTVSATGAGWDWIAYWGRPNDVLSEHPIDPRTLDGVDVFSADGGPVEDYLTESGEPAVGLAIGGHNAGASTDWMYRIHRSPGWQWFGVPGIGTMQPLVQMPDDSVGYFDPRGQSFMQAAADFAERVEERQ